MLLGQNELCSTAGAEGSGARFVTTHWSVVLVAGRNDSTRAQNALARLCHTYWYPLYAYMRRRAATSTSANSGRMCRTSPPQGRATHRSFRSRRRRPHCRRQSCHPHPRQRKPVTVGFCRLYPRLLIRHLWRASLLRREDRNGILAVVHVRWPGIWATIDWILILCKAFKDKKGRKLTKWT